MAWGISRKTSVGATGGGCLAKRRGLVYICGTRGLEQAVRCYRGH